MNDVMFHHWKLQQPSMLRLQLFMNDHISLNAREVFSAVLERPWLFSKGYWLFMNSRLCLKQTC
ncbi:hypothetical protein RchiOBHm_Chr5g0036181 [Rosa chinensis]|uniref:Uncharacterized protein n=1 Tax=Rosa chinensis TaxID=74649 RepID=A0A2P6QBE1_ROSCH|nr:hypothetical protein RchiOBHm_Chr5g0036181 [Rosa chinensis]